jgi:putative GTP pyrophosphokinase
VTRTQVDRLGDRLKEGEITEDDLRLLDEFRKSFTPSYEDVVRGIREHLGAQTTGRPAKSTTSIIEKLRRESIRLSQIQDIAGCRFIVPDIHSQDRAVAELSQLFTRSVVVDRRERPSHGYRAVHVIVGLRTDSVEVQVRTALQHVWAELSEKIADKLGNIVKYGGGDESTRAALTGASAAIARQESLDRQLADLEAKLVMFPDEEKRELRSVRADLEEMKREFAEKLETIRLSL